MNTLGEGSYGVESVTLVSGIPVKSEKFSDDRFVDFGDRVDFQNEFKIY